MANAVIRLLDDAVREGHGARPALRTPAGEVSYAALLDVVQHAAAGLRARGVGREDRVALLLPDGLAWVATFLGALRIGAVAMPLNTRLPGAGLATLFADARPHALVADPTLLAGVVDTVRAAGIPQVLSFEALLSREGAKVAAEPVSADTMAVWIYTSGTTGTPKAAMHRHGTMVAGGHYADSIVGLRAEDRILATSRLFFAYALGNALLNPLLARATACLVDEWPTVETLGALLREHRPTLLFSVPTFYARVLAAELPADSLASVRVCVSAGERLPAEVYRAWRERFGLEILDGIGATETIFMVLSSRAGASRPGTTGGPVPGSEARLLDADGRPVAPGQQGVLWVKTPSVAAGYWGRPDDTRRAFDGGWFRFGDVYYVDPDGHWVHCGRQDDLFKVAGQWVIPSDVEAVVLRHPDVVEAGLVGAEEGSGLIKPYLFVVLRPDAGNVARLTAELTDRLAREVPTYARPREVRVVPELPRTTTGKLQRHRLRDMLT